VVVRVIPAPPTIEIHIGLRVVIGIIGTAVLIPVLTQENDSQVTVAPLIRKIDQCLGIDYFIYPECFDNFHNLIGRVPGAAKLGDVL
jgi:hypothetical protein